MKLKTAETSDSTHPGWQTESTPERVLEAASTLLCEHGFSGALAKNLSPKLTKEGPLRATSLNAKTIHPSLPSLSAVKVRASEGIKVYPASPSRNDPALPEISEDLQKHRFCLDIFVETEPAGF